MKIMKDWPELVSIINKSLAAMTDDQHRELRQKAFAMRFEYGVDMARIKKIAAWAGAGSVPAVISTK